MSVEPLSDVDVRVTQYTVSLISEGSISRHSFEITVEYRGRDRWAVKHGGACLGRDNSVDYESLPSGREEEWLARYRFAEEEALRQAAEWAKIIRVNGKTAAEVLEWETARE